MEPAEPACTYKTARHQLDVRARGLQHGSYREIINYDGTYWRLPSHGADLVGQKIILFGRRNRANPFTDAGWRVVRVDEVVETPMGRPTEHIVSMEGPDYTYREQVALNSRANPWSRGFDFAVVDQGTLTGNLDTTTDDLALLSLARWSRHNGEWNFAYDTKVLSKYPWFNDLRGGPTHYFNTLSADALNWITRDRDAMNNIVRTRFLLQYKRKQAEFSMIGLRRLLERRAISVEEEEALFEHQRDIVMNANADDRRLSRLTPDSRGVGEGQFGVEDALISIQLKTELDALPSIPPETLL